jgi:flagellar basal-body rod protein FlgC
MAFLSSLNIAGSSFTAQKLRMDVISQNIANADSTSTQNGGPYRRKVVVLGSRGNNSSFQSILNTASNNPQFAGVEVKSIADDNSDFKTSYDPGNPNADANGNVMIPNVDTTKEMVDMISASRSYEANVTAFNAVKLMATRALDIGK